MNRLNKLSLFTPHHRIFTLLAIINIALLFTSFSVVDIIHLNEMQAGKLNDGSYSYQNTMTKYGNNLYWISFAQKKMGETQNSLGLLQIIYDQSYFLNIFNQDNKIKQIPILKFNLTTDFGDLNSSSYSFTLNILSSSFVLIFIKEVTFLSFQNPDKNVGGLTGTAIETNFLYLLQISNSFSISKSKLLKLDIPENLTLSSISTQNQTYDLLFGNKNFNSVAEFGNRTVDYSLLVSSPNLIKQFQNIMENSSYSNTNLNQQITFSSGFSFAPNAQSYNLTSYLQNSLQSKFFPIVMYPAKIALVDSQQRVHITGSSTLSDNSGGNYTGLNYPDYVMVDTLNNKTYYWQIVPSTSFYDFNSMNYYQFEEFGSQILILVDTSNINTFYNDSSKWNLSPNFNYNVVTNWDRNTTGQLIIFDPATPTNKNYIQFGQPSNANITYPRIYQSLLVPFIKARLILSDNQINIYASLYNMENGKLRTNLIPNTGTSMGASLYKYTIDYSQNTLKIISVTRLFGLNKPIKPATSVNLADPLNYLEHVSKYSGWHINDIYYVFERNSIDKSQTFVLTESTYVPINPITNAIGYNQFYNLLITEVN